MRRGNSSGIQKGSECKLKEFVQLVRPEYIGLASMAFNAIGMLINALGIDADSVWPQCIAWMFIGVGCALSALSIFMCFFLI